jgi:signal transduction histidine kinase
MQSNTIIGERAQQVLEQWESTVRERVPQCAQLAPGELRGKMPSIAAHAGRLSGRGIIPEDDVAEIAAEHARLRAAQGFDAASLCAEFELLRRGMLQDRLTQGGGAHVDAVDILRTIDVIDAAQRHALAALFDQQSRDLARSHEAFDQFLSFMSHDLRGGLNGVLLMAEVVRRELQPRPDLHGCVDDLEMIRNSLIGTVTNLERYLYAERFRRGKVATRMSGFDVRDVVNEQVKRHTYDAKQKGVILRVEAPDSCPVTTDRSLVALILGNLISNAIKHGCGDGSGRNEVRVAIERPAHDERRVRLVVTDQGNGIESATLARLLAPTPEADAAANGKTGLGIYNCRHAAKEIGGRLTADSTVGGGSTFRVELPS